MPRIELEEKILEGVSGGNITFTPNKSGNGGKLGRNGKENYSYKDEDAVMDFIMDHMHDKKFKTSKAQDNYLLNALLEAGLIKAL